MGQVPSQPAATDEANAVLSALLVRIAAADEDAMSQFTRLGAAWIRPVCHRLLSNAADAEEVRQEVLLAIWLKAGKFDPSKGRATAWITRVARNRAIDFIRARSPIVTEPLEQGWDIPDLAPLPEQTYALNQAADHLRAGLSRLPPYYSTALTAVFTHEQTHHEFSENTSTPLGTVKARVRRGLLALRRDLKFDEIRTLFTC